MPKITVIMTNTIIDDIKNLYSFHIMAMRIPIDYLPLNAPLETLLTPISTD